MTREEKLVFAIQKSLLQYLKYVSLKRADISKHLMTTPLSSSPNCPK